MRGNPGALLAGAGKKTVTAVRPAEERRKEAVMGIDVAIKAEDSPTRRSSSSRGRKNSRNSHSLSRSSSSSSTHYSNNRSSSTHYSTQLQQ